MFTLATPLGIMLDFDMYIGKDTCKNYGLGISKNFLHLAEVLPKNQNFKIHTNNWFTSLYLAVALRKEGHHFLGTCRSNRIGKCTLKNEKDLKKSERGSYDYKVETLINIVTTYAKIKPVTKCKRWCREDKLHVDVDRPITVTKYNQLMGGVNLCDLLLEMYKINIPSRIWYTRIFYCALGVAVVNSWLLYRRKQKIKNQKSEFTLVQWQAAISNELNVVGKTTLPKKRGQPSSEFLLKTASVPSSSKRIYQPNPTKDSRLDNIGHFPQFSAKQNKC